MADTKGRVVYAENITYNLTTYESMKCMSRHQISQ